MRGFGFLLGLFLLIEGLPKIFNPQFWTVYTERNLKGRLPEEATRTLMDFSKLSDNATRSLALTEIFAGLMLVFMASAMRYRAMMFGGMRGPWMGGPWMGWRGMGPGMGPGMGHGMGMMGGHSHPHTHPHTPHDHEEGGMTPTESV